MGLLIICAPFPNSVTDMVALICDFSVVAHDGRWDLVHCKRPRNVCFVFWMATEFQLGLGERTGICIKHALLL
jgi:hypothetical protein